MKFPEVLYKPIFFNSINGTIIIDIKGIILTVNPVIELLFGYKEEELIGKNVKILMGSEDSSKHDFYLERYLTTGKKKIIGIGREISGMTKNHETIPLHLSINEIKKDGNHIFVGTFVDLSERNKKEIELEKSRNYFKAIFDSSIESILIINKRGIIQMANQATSTIFGYDPEFLEGKNVSILMASHHAKQHDKYLENYLTTGIKKIIGIGREEEGQKKSGELFPLKLSVSEFEVVDQVYFMGIIHDLSEQKRAKQEILDLNQKLEEKVSDRTEELSSAVNQLLSTNEKLNIEMKERAKIEEELRSAYSKEKELNELKSRFISMASHEFRTPLATILSSASIIGKYVLEDQQPKRDKHINRIKSTVKNLNNILEDFILLSKQEEGKVEKNIEEFDLYSAYKGVIDDMSGILKESQKINYTFENTSLVVKMNKSSLKNILYNLFSNAIKYSDNDIDFRAKYNNEKIEFQIQDYGIGIPWNDQEYLFQRFFRASNVINIQGTGLGLNIINQYLEMMNGSISFVSEPGQGSTFTVKIPLQHG
jgi:PAS domain S-box-containing protein